ncbi:MAG: hypothetical protein ACLT98_05185 [Eggerthellaceae bacterium]
MGLVLGVVLVGRRRRLVGARACAALAIRGRSSRSSPVRHRPGHRVAGTSGCGAGHARPSARAAQELLVIGAARGWPTTSCARAAASGVSASFVKAVTDGLHLSHQISSPG